MRGGPRECSTPFGITEVGAPSRRRLLETFQAGAQRLSASQRWARGCGPRGNRVSVCSTPFGITEVGALRDASSGPQTRRCSTPFGITEVGATAPHTWASRRRCAQRLSASQRWARPARALKSECLRCSTPFGITEVGASVETSTSRTRGCAQRLSASQRWARARIRRRRRPILVLNAFRHHRGVRVYEHAIIEAGDPECSTPFGITEVGAGGNNRPVALRRSAQRLSASQRWARLTIVMSSTSPAVLNAFRHHRGGRHRANGPYRGPGRAQRLSASQRWALSTYFLGLDFNLCSTPFGITEVGA